ncbi:MAG TPA: hypothetical protein VGE68_08190 [Sphingomicrobium sp.]
MSLKFTCLATAATIAFAATAYAQDANTTEPTTTTTQSTTTQTQPTTAPAEPSTTQTTTSQPTTTPEGQPATTTQTTTTQTQPTTTTEGQPAATTTQTTTTQTSTVTAATAEDIKAGVVVFDQAGARVGKVDSVDSDGAVVNTGKARAKIPLASFGKNEKGLVISVSKAELDTKAKPDKSDAKTDKKPKS